MIRGLLCGVLLMWGASAQAALKAGGARTLRLSSNAATLDAGEAIAIPSERGYDLVFRAERRGVPDLYRATRGTSARAIWQADPITNFAPGLGCFSPSPTPDGTGVLCVFRENLRAGAKRGKVARLDLGSGQLTPLTSDARCQEPSMSPDGRRVAWNSDRNGAEAVYVSTEGAPPRRIASSARGATWLDRDTLLYESLRDGSRGLYRVRLTPEGRRVTAQSGDDLLWSRGGRASVSPDGTTLAVSARDDKSERLYLLSVDGSGARAAGGTEGARHPKFLPDGSGVLYDAPLPGTRARSLWLLPLRDVTPVAALLEARPMRQAPGTLEIYGTAWCEGEETRATLSVGEGDEPSSYTALSTVRTPAHQTLLGRWTPPADARGTWTVKLSVRTTSGEEAENTLPIQLPLAEGPPALLQPEAAPFAAPVTPPSTAPSTRQEPTQARATPGSTRRIPAPSDAASPLTRAVPNRTPRSLVSPFAVPGRRGALVGDLAPNAGAPPVELPAIPTRRPTRNPNRRDRQPRIARVPNPTNGSPVASSSALPRENDAQTDVVGTPATMRAAEVVSVQALLRNTGTRAWSPSGRDTVRLVARWQDLDRGYRARWQFVWPREAASPGETARVTFPLTAPRAGRYKLTYFLVRTPGGSVRPPSARGDAPWPGEFGAASYLVVVR